MAYEYYRSKFSTDVIRYNPRTKQSAVFCKASVYCPRTLGGIWVEYTPQLHPSKRPDLQRVTARQAAKLLPTGLLYPRRPRYRYYVGLLDKEAVLYRKNLDDGHWEYADLTEDNDGRRRYEDWEPVRWYQFRRRFLCWCSTARPISRDTSRRIFRIYGKAPA